MTPQDHARALAAFRKSLRDEGLKDVAADPQALVAAYHAAMLADQVVQIEGIKSRLDFALEGGKLPIEFLNGLDIQGTDHPLMGETFSGIATGLEEIAKALWHIQGRESIEIQVTGLEELSESVQNIARMIDINSSGGGLKG